MTHEQVLVLFAKLRVEDEEVRDWVLRVLRARTREEQDYTREQRAELQRQLSEAVKELICRFSR